MSVTAASRGITSQKRRQDAFKANPNKANTIDKSRFITRVHSMDNNYTDIGSKFYPKNNYSLNSASYNGNHIPNGHSKLQHQNSTIVQTVIDPDKLEAAKKRREENAEKELQKDQKVKVKKNWRQRLKWLGTTILSLTVIFSGSSLLFIIPIIVDPILAGFQAQFSTEPVQCRVISYKYEFGTVQCDTPSCREGCTADIYNCTFIYVTYTKDPWKGLHKSKIRNDNSSSSVVPSFNTTNEYNFSTTAKSFAATTITKSSDYKNGNEVDWINEDASFVPDSNITFYNATLYITPTGCGYPPEINCTEFNSKYLRIGKVFPCYFSAAENSKVVPFYSHANELYLLGFSIGLPLSFFFVGSILLYFVLKWKALGPDDIKIVIKSSESKFGTNGKEKTGTNDDKNGVDKSSKRNGKLGNGESKNRRLSKMHSNANSDKWAHSQENNHAKTTIDIIGEETTTHAEITPTPSTSFKANGHGPSGYQLSSRPLSPVVPNSLIRAQLQYSSSLES